MNRSKCITWRRIRTGHASVESVDCGPLSGTLLASLVEDLVHEGLTIVVLELKDVGGDLDEEGVENALVPLVEDVGDLVLADTKTAFEDIISLSDQLHVTVFDTFGDG